MLEKYYKNQIFVLSLMLFLLAFTPFLLKESYHDSQRLISVLTMTVVLLLFIWRMTLSRYLRNIIMVLLSVGGILVLLSPDRLWSFVEFALLSLSLLLILALWSSVSKQQLLGLAVVFSAIQGIYVFRNLLNYSFAVFLQSGLDSFLIVDGFSNVRFYGQFLTWTVPFVVGVIALYEHVPYRKVIILILMISCAFMLLTGTRAFWLAMVFTLPITWWFSSNTYWWIYVRKLLAVIAGGVLGYVLLAFIIPWLFNIDFNSLLDKSLERDLTSSSGRIAIWANTWQFIQLEPLWGIGPMMTASVDVYNGPAHPHNYLLQFIVEWGSLFTLGGIILVLGSLCSWRRAIKEDLHERVYISLPIVASLSAGAAAGLVSGLIVMPVSLVYMVLIASLAVGSYKLWTPQVKRYPLPTWVAIVCLIPSIWLSAFTFKTYGSFISDLERGQKYKLESMVNHPRFWSQGKIKVDLSPDKD